MPNNQLPITSAAHYDRIYSNNICQQRFILQHSYVILLPRLVEILPGEKF